jgi:hypothetical protein
MPKQLDVAFDAKSMTREQAVHCLLPAWRSDQKRLRAALRSGEDALRWGNELLINPICDRTGYHGWVGELNTDQRDNLFQALTYFSEHDRSNVIEELRLADKPIEGRRTGAKAASCFLCPEPLDAAVY